MFAKQVHCDRSNCAIGMNPSPATAGESTEAVGSSRVSCLSTQNSRQSYLR